MDVTLLPPSSQLNAARLASAVASHVDAARSGAALLDGASPWQRFRFITFPMLLPILAIVMTFSIIFTFTDFQLVYAITRGGPVNSTHILATLAFQRGIPGGQLGEGAAIAVAMLIAVVVLPTPPFWLAIAITNMMVG